MKRELILVAFGLMSAATMAQVDAQAVPDPVVQPGPAPGVFPPPPPAPGSTPGVLPPPPPAFDSTPGILSPLSPAGGPAPARPSGIPPSQRGPGASFVDATTLSGKVKTYLLNPSGQIDGVLLSDGKQLHLPPHLSASLERIAKPGSTIQAAVEPGVQSQFGQEYRTISLLNTQSGATIVDQPPMSPPPPPAPGQQMNARGTLAQFLVGHLGELNGFILSDGTQVHFPPPQSASVSQQIKLGDKIAVEGFGARSVLGASLDMTGLSVNGQSLSLYGGPRP